MRGAPRLMADWTDVRWTPADPNPHTAAMLRISVIVLMGLAAAGPAQAAITLHAPVVSGWPLVGETIRCSQPPGDTPASAIQWVTGYTEVGAFSTVPTVTSAGGPPPARVIGTGPEYTLTAADAAGGPQATVQCRVLATEGNIGAAALSHAVRPRSAGATAITGLPRIFDWASVERDLAILAPVAAPFPTPGMAPAPASTSSPTPAYADGTAPRPEWMVNPPAPTALACQPTIEFTAGAPPWRHTVEWLRGGKVVTKETRTGDLRTGGFPAGPTTALRQEDLSASGPQFADIRLYRPETILPWPARFALSAGDDGAGLSCRYTLTSGSGTASVTSWERSPSTPTTTPPAGPAAPPKTIAVRRAKGVPKEIVVTVPTPTLVTQVAMKLTARIKGRTVSIAQGAGRPTYPVLGYVQLAVPLTNKGRARLRKGSFMASLTVTANGSDLPVQRVRIAG